jgi:hypothetical protein
MGASNVTALHFRRVPQPQPRNASHKPRHAMQMACHGVLDAERRRKVVIAA